jgi:hypothetical protein
MTGRREYKKDERERGCEPPERSKRAYKKAAKEKGRAYKQSLADRGRRVPMKKLKEEAPQAATGGGGKKDPSEGRGWSSEESSSSENSEDAYMVMKFSIPGEAAGAVIGTGRMTLKLIKERTGSRHIEVRGKRMDTHREVRVTIKTMAEGSRVQKAVK